MTKLSPAARALKAKLGELRGKKMRKKKMSDDPLAYHTGMKNEFYSCRRWRELRWEVLKENAAKHPDGKPHCAMCGKGAEIKKPLEVDHIKPRFYYPMLELVKSNLQVLCQDCNQGKGCT